MNAQRSPERAQVSLINQPFGARDDPTRLTDSCAYFSGSVRTRRRNRAVMPFLHPVPWLGFGWWPLQESRPPIQNLAGVAWTDTGSREPRSIENWRDYLAVMSQRAPDVLFCSFWSSPGSSPFTVSVLPVKAKLHDDFRALHARGACRALLLSLVCGLPVLAGCRHCGQSRGTCVPPCRLASRARSRAVADGRAAVARPGLPFSGGSLPYSALLESLRPAC